MIKYIPLLLSLGAQAEDIPAKYILADSQPYYIANSATTLLGSVIIFNVYWEGKGEQRVIAGCKEYNYGLPDISPEMYTAEPESEMFDLITEACGDVQWI